MELRYWLAAFRALHERARKGELSSGERIQYLSQREELARALLVAQKLTTLPGQTARQTLRMARALQVDLDLAEGRQRLLTTQVSSGGFGALMPNHVPKGSLIRFSMRLPGSPEPLVGRLKVLEIQPRDGNAMVSFAFEGLSAAEQRLELALFDTVLQQFEGMAF